MELQDRIKFIRKNAGLSQKEFAESIGVQSIVVSRWENGKTDAGKARLYVIADKFKVNIKWLQTGEGEPYIKQEIDETTRRQIESEYIGRLFDSLPAEMQQSILRVMRDKIEELNRPKDKSNIINNSGTINGNIQQEIKCTKD